MTRLLQIVIFVFSLVVPVQAAMVNGWTYYTFDSYQVILTNAPDDQRLLGWIELRSGGTLVGNIHLKRDADKLSAPSLGGTPSNQTISMSVPISSLDTLINLLEHQMPMQVRFTPDTAWGPSVFLEAPFPAGTSIDERMAPLGLELGAIGGKLKAFSAPSTSPISLANWNIQTLTVPGEKVFANQKTADLRTEADFGKLRIVRDKLAADVFAFQEISSLRALAKIFPTSDWQLCFSGQYDADAAGLGPDYDGEGIASIAPTCVVDQDDATLPDLAPGKLRGQYVAFAIRRDSPVKLASIADVPELNKPHESIDAGQVYVRTLRWGLDATFDTPSGKARVLNVHLKSRCTTKELDSAWWLAAKSWSPNGDEDEHCEVLARQLPALRAWIASAKMSEVPFVIVGDINRQLDAEADDALVPDLFPILTGAATPTDATDDAALTYVPEGAESEVPCWLDNANTVFRHAIEFYVFGPGDRPADWESTYRKVRYIDLPEVGGLSLDRKRDSPHLSDHCPEVLAIW